MSDITISPPTEHSRYSLHPEVDVVETPPHRRQIEYLETNLRSELPHLFVGGNIGVYWVPGAYEEPWVGPDVLVSRHTLAMPPPRVYLVWEYGPVRFVGEVASDRTRRAERRKRETRYRVDLQIPEYLYIDLERHQLELWRLEEGEYQRVPDVEGRLHSHELNLWFAWDAQQEFVRVWTADGRMLLTKEEDLEQNRALIAERDAVRAEREAAREEAAEALARAREAETRAAELAAELERLRRLHDAGPPEGHSKAE